MITEYDFIFGAGAVAFLALLWLAALVLPDVDDPDSEMSWLTEADLDDEDEDDLDYVKVDRGEVLP